MSELKTLKDFKLEDDFGVCDFDYGEKAQNHELIEVLGKEAIEWAKHFNQLALRADHDNDRELFLAMISAEIEFRNFFNIPRGALE